MANPETALATLGSSVLQRLISQVWKFDFFQAVWLLERMTAGSAAVGGRGPVTNEPIRFRPDLSVGFPATDLSKIMVSRESGQATHYWLDVTFMGLYGVSTPLPLHYAISILRGAEPQTVSDRGGPPITADAGPDQTVVHETSPVRDFLDILHHRLISLFYRGCTKYRYDVTFGMPERDRITDYLVRLMGLAPDWDARVLGLDPIRMIRYAGTLTQHPRSSMTLAGVLSDYWDGLSVETQQFVGRWVPVGADDANRMGAANCRLGMDLIVGEEVYDLSGAFNVAVGPVDWATFLRFLPDGEAFAQTQSLVRLYCSDPLSFTIEVKLAARQVPRLCLSSDDEAGRLGYTSWVRTDEMAETSVIFEERAAA